MRSIVARADGIPLYAVETIRMLVADGRLAEVDGAVRAGRRARRAGRARDAPGADRGSPRWPRPRPTGRSSRTPPSSARASHSPALAAVRAAKRRRSSDGSATSVRRELLIQDVDPRSPERGQYAFVQALIREVAYSTLANRDRRARHLAAARYFESLGEDELAGALAAHYMAA